MVSRKCVPKNHFENEALYVDYKVTINSKYK